MKMWAAGSSKTLVISYETTLCLKPQDHNPEVFIKIQRFWIRELEVYVASVVFPSGLIQNSS
jgi:hypothetical protein